MNINKKNPKPQTNQAQTQQQETPTITMVAGEVQGQDGCNDVAHSLQYFRKNYQIGVDLDQKKKGQLVHL